MTPLLALVLVLLGGPLTARAQTDGAEALTPPAPTSQPAPAAEPPTSAPAPDPATPPDAASTAPAPAVPPAPAPAPATQYVYPAPPPNYSPNAAPPAGTPQAPGPSVAEATWTQELRAIDARLNQLQARRREQSIGGPITVLAGGFGGAILSMLIISSAVEEIDDRRNFGESIKGPRNVAIAFGAVAVVSTGVGVAGVLWLRSRQRVRKAHDPEIRALRKRRQDIRQQLRYELYYAPQGPQASLTLKF